jgi:hypothetical protein
MEAISYSQAASQLMTPKRAIASEHLEASTLVDKHELVPAMLVLMNLENPNGC